VGIEVVAAAPVSVSAPATGAVEGTLVVSGSGWITTDVSESAVVALKIELAADSSVTINHVTGKPAVISFSGNLSRWAYARANLDGDVSVEILLPDGTSTPDAELSSNPAFTAGEYKIRALAGSIQGTDRAGVALSQSVTIS
jgi:hypothetical protein